MRLSSQAVLLAALYSFLLWGCSSSSEQKEMRALEITAPKLVFSRYAQQRLTAVGTYSDGSKREVTAELDWFSSDPDVLQVGNGAQNKGKATPVGDGSVTVTASTGKLSSSIELSVVTTEMHRKMYEGVLAGPDAAMFEYAVNMEWFSIAANHPYWAYKQPHISWKTFWALEGFCYGYLATDDEFLARSFFLLFNALLARQDRYQGRISWDGKLYPLWGGTSRYHGAELELRNASGAPAGKLKFYGNSHDQTQVTLHNLSGGRFDLSFRNAGNMYTLEGAELTTLQERVSELSWRSYLSPLPAGRVVAYEPTLVPTSLPLRELSNQLVQNLTVPNVVLSGLILRPVALMYRALKEKGDPRASILLPCLRDGIASLLPLTWRDLGEEGGYFTDPMDSPTAYGGGTIIPWNQQAGFISAIAIYAGEEDDQPLKSVVRKWQRYFLNSRTAIDGCRIWLYWNDPKQNVNWYDSTDYAGYVVEALLDIEEAGLGAEGTPAELAAMVQGKLLQRYLATGVLPRYIDSTGTGSFDSLYRYAGLSPWLPELSRLLNESTSTKWYDAARLLYYRSAAAQKQYGR